MDDFEPHGIYFSLVGLEFLPVPEDVYNYSLGPDTIFTYNGHEDAIDIYFLADTVKAGDAGDAPSKHIVIGGVADYMPVTESHFLTHEMGHSFGLYHTFNGFGTNGEDQIGSTQDDCTKGDLVKDTPPDANISVFCIDTTCYYDASLNIGCSTWASDYPTDPNDPLNLFNVVPKLALNYMSYSPYRCKSEFTQGQVNRMKYILQDTILSMTQVLDDSVRIGFPFTMTSPKNCYSNITIEQGGKLTIRDTLTMLENAGITVNKGARLEIDAGVIKGCEGQPWTGLIVEGYKNLPQTLPPSDQQGFLRLLPGSIIEGAKTSIDVASGGMVIATGCTIQNCGGMVFAPYDFPTKSRFDYCDFTCNGNVYDFGTDTYYHATLFGINNLNFNACNFSVDNVPPAAAQKTNGILAYDALFRVYNGSTFRGFDAGIHASGSYDAMKAFTADNCTFSDNHTGIVAMGVQNFTITNNTFEVGGSNITAITPRGLEMNNCTGYTVEKNTFSGKDNLAADRYGILTFNSGDDGNFISGNNFDFLAYANAAQGDNRGDFVGLQYLCNANLGNNLRDFWVPDDPNTPNNTDGIHLLQGNGQATMNTFSHYAPGTDSDFRNEVGVIIYNYKVDPAHEPNPSTPPGTGGIDKVQAINENTCPSDAPPCDFPCQFPPTEWQQIRDKYNTSKAGWLTEKSTFEALLDGGNTDSLLDLIGAVTSGTAGQLAQDLLNLSPWLSSEVLSATVAQKQVLSDAAVQQILQANPDALREAELQALVQAEFSQTTADSILARTGTPTVRTETELNLGRHRSDMLRSADLLIQDLLRDTNAIERKELRSLLADKQSLEADYATVAGYLAEGDYLSASQKLDSIPLLHQLDADDLTEHAYFGDLTDLWQDTYTAGKTMANLDSLEIASVQHIADNSQRRAGALAQGILNTWYGSHYRVTPILSGGGAPQGLIAPPAGHSHLPSSEYLSVYPNPARNIMTFRWNLPDDTENATIFLFDLNGKKLEVLKIVGQHGKIDWSTKKMEHGVYLYRLQLPDGRFQTSKVIVIK